VAVAPGQSLPYQEADWRDAMVTVERGEIVLETVGGSSWFFGQGDVLWLTGLPLAALRNRGPGETRLVATSRRL
jgi:hypothetical protein